MLFLPRPPPPLPIIKVSGERTHQFVSFDAKIVGLPRGAGRGEF